MKVEFFSLMPFDVAVSDVDFSRIACQNVVE
jgi:hypothetical protein